MKKSRKLELRLRRKKRIRSKVLGTSEKPRLSVFRSARHILGQIIDDDTGNTLVSISSISKETKKRANKGLCFELGKKLAEACKGKNIMKIVFDKNGFTYHGRLKAFADGMREGGIKF